MTETPDDYARVHAILAGVRPLPEAAREVYVAEACGDDRALRARIVELLALDRDDGTRAFTEDQVAGVRIALDGALDAPPEAALPETVGPFTIIRRLGTGGMGAVYEAEQDEPRRRVALKVVRTPMVTRDLLQRFRHEARVLGHLRHPGIAQIYEVGTTDTGAGGQPYFAMELVEGATITDFAETNGLDTRARLELLAQLCDILEYAHRKGVIHRDIKPANILVAAEATGTGSGVHGAPLLKVLDFGVARATDADLNTVTLQTTMGQLVGTVPYMSPEQASGDPGEIDTRSDVYSVGVLGWELLTGRLPYDVQGKMVHEAVRVIREEEPSRLSSIDRSLRGDVETILAKALEKDKERRYQSAADFAADIRRHLADEPIAARPASTVYQLRKFARRHKALVAGVVATFVVAIAGAGVATRYAVVARRQAEDLEQIVAYQSGLLTGIDIETMGARLRDRVLSGADAAMRRSGLSEAELAHRRGQLVELIAGTNFTDISRHMLNENVYADALSGIEARLGDQPLLQAELFQSLADTLHAIGLYRAAFEPQERALDIRLRILGEDHPDTLTSLFGRGMRLEWSEEWAPAESIYRAVLAKRRQRLGDEHADTLAALSRLAYVLTIRGNREEGDALTREYAAAVRRQLGDDHPTVLATNAGLRWMEGRFEEAEPLYRRILEDGRRVHGDDARITALLEFNLANVLVELDALAEAEALYGHGMRVLRDLCGETHPDTLKLMRSYGDTLYRRGRLVEAEAVLGEALRKTRLVMGDPNHATMQAKEMLGATLREMGRFAEAEPLLLAAFADRETLAPADVDARLRLIEEIARLYERWDKPARAGEWRRKQEMLRAGEPLVPSAGEPHGEPEARPPASAAVSRPPRPRSRRSW